MSTVDIKYLAKLVVNGVSQAKAAAAMGCTQGYISQLVETSQPLRDAIAEEETLIIESTLKKATSLQEIENDLLIRAKELIPYSESVGETVTALQRISDMKDRNMARTPTGHSNGNVLELNLGKIAQARIKVEMGGNGVIMHLGDKSMARAPARAVKSMLEARKQKNASITFDQPETDVEVWDTSEAATR